MGGPLKACLTRATGNIVFGGDRRGLGGTGTRLQAILPSVDGRRLLKGGRCGREARPQRWERAMERHGWIDSRSVNEGRVVFPKRFTQIKGSSLSKANRIGMPANG